MALSKKKTAERKIRNIGIEAKPPQKHCSDPKCPWHGSLSLRGKIVKGTVISSRAPKTAVIEWGFVRYVPKYERYERRTGKIVAYNPECIAAKAGSIVKAIECRPLSKTKSFAVVEVIK